MKVIKVVLFLLILSHEVSSQNKLPNIVMYVADDLGTYDIGPYGNKKVKTPNLDALAKESMRFKNAFAAAPTCAPSRMSLFTGLYPLNHGAVANEMGVYERISTIVQYLKPLGYKVAIAGKLHVGPRSVFDFEYIAETNGKEPNTAGLKGMFPDLVVEPLKGWFSEQSPDHPFLLIIADHSPHVTWPLVPIYKPENVSIPPQLLDTKKTRELMSRYYTDVTKMDTNLGSVLQMLKASKLDDAAFIFTADQGPQFPFGKWTLYDYGIQAPLMVKWPGYVKPNSVTSSLISHVDIVPTFIEMAGGLVPSNIDGKSFLTVLDNSKLKHHEFVYASHSGDKMNNRAVIRMIRTQKFKYILNLSSEDAFSRTNEINLNVREIPKDWYTAAYRDKKAVATLWRATHQPREEFYDLEKDPHELRNVAYDNDYEKNIKWFRDKMREERNNQGDTDERWKKDLDSMPIKGNTSVAPYGF